MKDISLFFHPIGEPQSNDSLQLGNTFEIHTASNFPDLENKGIALYYVPETRNTEDQQPHDTFRKELYNMYKGSSWKGSLYDLGIIQPGENINDTYHAIKSINEELIKNDIIPLVIGGGQDLTHALYQAYEGLEQFVNLTTIDHHLDLNPDQKAIDSNNWLQPILLQKPCFLFNYANLGMQRHYNSPKTLNLFEELYFDIYPLGALKSDLKIAEPTMRNTDILSLDLTSISSSAMEGNYYTEPNGFNALEICNLMRYAGISDKLTSFGIFNLSDNAASTITNKLIGQIIWYFIEGYEQRKGDFPIGSKKSYKKYRVHLDELNEEIVFNKSNKSGRWWMEVPYPGTTNSRFLRHQSVPCTYEDYQEAMRGEIPDLWWKTYQKFI